VTNIFIVHQPSNTMQ